MRRLAVLLAAAALALPAAGCGGGEEPAEEPAAEEPAATETEAAALEPREVSMVMNWFAQSEHGGYWQIAAEEIGADQGVTIDVEQGGPQIQTIPQVASGEFDYGLAIADQLLLGRSEGAPVVALFSPLNSPRCVIFQTAAGIDSFEDIEGHPVAIAAAGGWWEFVKNRFELDEVREINFTGQLTELKQNDQLVQQCFFTSEPFEAEQQGIDAETLLISEAGYNPYTNFLFTTERKIREDPEEVAAVVAAAKEGWEQFIADPAAGIAHIIEVNEEMTEDKARFAHETIAEGLLVDPLGCMELERWQELHDQIREVGVLTEDVDVSAAFTNEFTPGCE
jgi:NitT/TauT family transport system substrate-binding protein